MKTWLWTVLFYILLFLLFFLPTIDTDFGWQLRCGRELLQFGKLCSPDRYSVLLPGYQWAYPVQVFPVLVALVFDHLGWWGLSIVNAILMSSTFIFLFRLLGERGEIKEIGVRREMRWLSIIFILITIYFSWGVLELGLRSQMFSIFFFVLVLVVLQKQKYRWMLPVIFLIWANTHGGFVLGLFVVGVYWFQVVVEYMGEKGNRGDRGRKVVRLTIVSIASGLATFVNPFSWRVYQEDWLHFGGGYRLSGLIAEWVSPAPQISLAMLFFLSVVLFWLLLKREKRLSFYLLLVVMTYLGITARRNVPYAFFTAAYVARGKIGERGVIGGIGKIGVTLLLLYTLFIQFPKTSRINTSWASYCTEGMLIYPCQASEFMKTQKPGRMFATYEWGGFLIWQLPDFPSLVDGRMPAWITPEGKSPYTIYLETIRTEGNWQQRLADYHLDYIFIQPGTFMDLKLRPNPKEFGWQEIYRDSVTVVYARV